MKFKNSFMVVLLAAIIQISCSEEEKHGPIENDSVVPGLVTNVEVTNISGGAVFRYDLPDGDDDLLYIEAKYSTKTGKEYKVRSSIYTDSLAIDGFGDTDTYDVNLFTIDRSENRSEPLTVQVTPLTPPITKIFDSFTITETFGGAKLQWENETREQIVITVTATDSISGVDGPLKEIETIYSASSIGDISIRGYDPQEYRFAIQIRDRWDNVSPTKIVTIVPLFEQALDKDLFEEIILPGDTQQVEPWNTNGPSRIPLLWDDEHGGGSSGDYRIVGINGDMPDNYYYTFDLGVEVKLSRMKFWQFTQENQKWLYFDAQYKKFEIWGASMLDTSGNWDNWVKLRDCEIIKPSGLPLGEGNFTDEDRQAALLGHDFDFPFDTPSVRYIRIKVNATFSGLNWCAAGEISLWGDY
ncbi:DUF4959 domain-containing protein [Flavivirga sp. 57AJ16]|uniref:DUF4959 domain-containing protein n=1 Tax=Flavivirga sp. 57AJ16 TaxID=3025307 RepID=UPI002366E3D9|nr:DUF4959 domain-containing protein [Flavivirga sp. 57AJ16]MDD7887729.1 DUF4959 domain-containing protein [Flavivirga sp. 57AJ16]